MVEDITPQEDARPGAIKLSLVGGGLEFHRQIDEATAAQIIGMVFAGAPPMISPPVQRSPAGNGAEASHTPPPRVTSESPDEPHVSPGEFLQNAQATRNPDKIVAFGEYLRLHRGKDPFTKADVIGLFQAAGEPAPSNPSRDMRWATSTRWIAPVHNKDGEYYVTTEGRRAVASRFPQEMRDATPQPKPRRSRKKSAGQGSDAD